MATKLEKQALQKLLEQIKTAQAWFDDTAYPRRSREAFEEALTEVKAIFKSGPDPDCPNCDGTGGALPGGACGVCWDWRGDPHWEYHAKRRNNPTTSP